MGLSSNTLVFKGVGRQFNFKKMNKAVAFIKESYVELRKVNWPSRKQTINYTVIVVSASIVVALFLGFLDKIFSTIIEKFIF